MEKCKQSFSLWFLSLCLKLCHTSIHCQILCIIILHWCSVHHPSHLITDPHIKLNLTMNLTLTLRRHNFATYPSFLSFRQSATEAEITAHIQSSQQQKTKQTWCSSHLLTQRLCILLVPTITKIINLSKVTGSFPVLFKSSVIKPLLRNHPQTRNSSKYYPF